MATPGGSVAIPLVRPDLYAFFFLKKIAPMKFLHKYFVESLASQMLGNKSMNM